MLAMKKVDRERLAHLVVPVPWDSQHFEIPIARITSPELNDSELEDVLSYAKSGGVHLVYWATGPKRNLSPSLLEKFSGLLADRKVTFTMKDIRKSSSCSVEKQNHVFEVAEYTQTFTTERLLSLAVEAGFLSRFNTDPFIGKDRFQSLFHVWMTRSVERELADIVFVALHPSHPHKYLGVITASVENGIGKIGLLSVATDYQGRGIGSLLMHDVHHWMSLHGIREVHVVTQEANLPACNLYVRNGYRLHLVQQFYHFWVQR